MIIFSAESNKVSERENIERTIEATEILKESGTYTTGTGCYQCVEETCFITNQVELGKQLAKEFGQDCYLERGHYNVWYLIETSTGRIIDNFKTIKQVSEERAKSQEYYTELNGKFYIATNY